MRARLPVSFPCSRQGVAAAAFTLVELMIVVVIISVLATIAAPTFVGVQQTDHLVRAAGEVERAFELARSQAVLRNAAMRVIVRPNAAGTLPNIRVDESPDASCSGWDRIAATDPAEATSAVASDCSTWNPTERHRCGLYTLHLTGSYAWAAYRDDGIRFTAVEEGEGTTWTPRTSEFVVCINRRGRMLVWTGTGDWVPIAGGLRFSLDRHDGSTPLGLTRRVFVPQGGIVGAIR